MKGISKETIARLNAITPSELVAHGVISTAPNFDEKNNRGYVCPLCGSGTGQNHADGRGSGAGKFFPNNRFLCNGCRNESAGYHSLSAIDLFAINRHLEHETFNEKCRQMAREFNVPIDFEERKFSYRGGGRRSSKKISAEIKPPAVDAKELELIRKDLFETPDSRLQTFVEKECGGSWRGFTADFLIKHGCKYINRWTPPKSRLENKYCTPTPRVLVPASADSYLARFCGKLDGYSDATLKFIEDTQKLHAGTKVLFNSDALTSNEPIFAVEGYIDAMSIELAEYKAVALGAVNQGNLLVDAVKSLKKKPQVIILLDSDKAGRNAAPKLYDDLLNVGCPCCVRFLADDESKIDCNEILTTQGEDNLRGLLEEIFDGSLAELSAVEEEFAKIFSNVFDEDERAFYLGGVVTDLQNARRLEKFCGSDVRWLKDEERWLVYGGGLWTRGSDKSAVLLPFVGKFADRLLASAELVDIDEQKKARAIAFQFQKRDNISAAVTMLKSCDSVLITADDLDKHANLLNCLNGVVDLENGKLYPHDPKYLITQQCRAAYEPNAKSELVDNFFKAIQPDEATRRGLLRWLGYNLTAENNEDKFMIWYGRGANGKGVLSHTLIELLGSYGTGLNPHTLLRKKFDNGDPDKPTTSLNPLEKRRFAISQELPLDGELNVALIKALTGGDELPLRLMFNEYRTIRNYAKINISGNFLPRIENTSDDGLLRRLITMPFAVKFGTPENPSDHSLKKKMLLPDNLNALLTLLVAESIAWYRGGKDGGLIISDAMKQETKQHLEQNDFVSSFIADNYERGVNLSVKAKDFVDALKREYPSECARFTKRADLINLVANTKGVTYCKGHGRYRVFKGIGKIGAPKQEDIDFDAAPVDTAPAKSAPADDDLPFDPNDMPFDD